MSWPYLGAVEPAHADGFQFGPTMGFFCGNDRDELEVLLQVLSYDSVSRFMICNRGQIVDRRVHVSGYFYSAEFCTHGAFASSEGSKTAREIADRRYGRERRRSRPKAHDVGTIDGMSSTNRRVIPTADSRLREKSRKPHDPRRIPTPFLDAKLALQRNMAARRARLELSQRALAELSGVNLAYLTQLETGHRNPSLLILGRLALALDTDIASLLRTAKGGNAAGSAKRYSTRGRKPG